MEYQNVTNPVKPMMTALRAKHVIWDYVRIHANLQTYARPQLSVDPKCTGPFAIAPKATKEIQHLTVLKSH